MVVDIRLPQEWEETGILPDSLLLTFFDEFGEINPEFLPKIKENFSPNDEIVLICRSARRTKFAIKFLKNHGFKNVRDIEGGILRLIAQNVCLEKFEPQGKTPNNAQN